MEEIHFSNLLHQHSEKKVTYRYRFHEASEQRYRFHKAIAQRALLRAVRSLRENGDDRFVKTVTLFSRFVKTVTI